MSIELRQSDTAYMLFYLSSSPKLFENHNVTTSAISKEIRGEIERAIADFNISAIDEPGFATKITIINSKFCKFHGLDKSHYLGGESIPQLETLIERSKQHAKDRAVNEILQAHHENVFTGADRLQSLHYEVSEAEKNNLSSDTDIKDAKEIQKRYIEILEDGYGDPLSTGISTLDALLGGGIYPCYAVIAARTSIGKTVMLTDMARRACQRGGHVLFFTFEMQDYRLMSRYVSYLTGISQNQLKQFNSLTQADQSAVTQAINKIRQWNLSMVDKSCNPAQIRGYVRSYIAARGKPDGIFVDYIQRVKGKGNDFERINLASSTLQEIYKEYNVPVIAAAQVNRSYTKSDKEGFDESTQPPNREDLKSSGNIEEDCDVVITMTRDRHAPETTMHGAVRKARDGEVGEWTGYFDGVRQSIFSDYDSRLKEINER